jgi:hypothetical protein
MQGGDSPGSTTPLKQNPRRHRAALSRVTYNREFVLPYRSDERGPLADIVFRQQVERGKRVRMCVSLRLRDGRDGRMKEIVRYDDHLGFHRHTPGLPPGRREEIPLPPDGDSVTMARVDLLAAADLYLELAWETGLEVLDDADDPDND